MQTYEEIKKSLLKLEEIHFQEVSESYRGDPKLGDCITGGVQFAALDELVSKSQQKLPVVATFGINYSQKEDSAASLFPYIGTQIGPAVEESTGCSGAVCSMIAAYNRNTDVWTKSTNPNARGGKKATSKARLQSIEPKAINERFIMFMVNRSQFISKFYWQDQVKADMAGCLDLLRKWPNEEYLDDLFLELNGTVDLWIGHSALHGTEWVWPSFNAFVKRHQINEWLFTPNISPRTNGQVKGIYQKPGHALYEFFKAGSNGEPN
jgi:hypothetical protein